MTHPLFISIFKNLFTFINIIDSNVISFRKLYGIVYKKVKHFEKRKYVRIKI